MPRKTACSTLEDGGTWPRFNEAAARCRGKPTEDRHADEGQLASMRPRPDAAENTGEVWIVCRRVGASMRPRPDAAEN